MRTSLLIIALSILASACKDGQVDPTVESSCGGKIEWVDFLAFPKYTSVENGNRIMIYESDKEPEDICTENHIKPKFSVSFFSPYSDSLRAGKGNIVLTASAQVPLRQPRKQRLIDNASLISAETEIEIGLKDAYPDKPGYINMQITAQFPSRGDYAADSTYLVNQIIAASIRLDYEKHVE